MPTSIALSARRPSLASKADLAAAKTEIAELRMELKTEIADLRVELKPKSPICEPTSKPKSPRPKPIF